VTLNGGFCYRERVQRGGATVLEHFALHHPHSTPERWRERIEAGEVELDGLPASPGAVPAPGQELAWHRPPWEEPEVDLDVRVVFEDAALVAVVKPSGLPTLPGGGFLEHTLMAVVRDRFPGASPMHRLGRGTSGLVLFSRTPEAGAALQSAWREHRVDKRYRALAAGDIAWDELDIRTPIGPVPHPWLGTLFAASPGGKPSRSVARVLERRGDATLVEVDLHTGRPHQIRIHLASVGHPLAGDPLFGPGGLPREDLVALPGDLGYLLHAERLAFRHPVTGLAMELRAEPPARLACGFSASPGEPRPGGSASRLPSP
jgi:23S rRNA pseudouridine1911/1915/1917 synthase